MIKDPLIRRCVRLLAAVHELHKQGYQDLAVNCTMAPSGTSWRCSLIPFDCIQWNGSKWREIPGANLEPARHSSVGTGNEYFGWIDAKSDSARELAEKIKLRFPRLMASTKRLNQEFAGWFTYMMGMAEQGHLPIMGAEYQEPFREKLATTTKDVWIKGPPLFTTFEIRGITYYHSQPPHLKPDDDWHMAYRRLIDGWQNAKNYCAVPQLPTDIDGIFEHGAYWEGAIYYIQKVLGFTDIRAFLSEVESVSQPSEPWELFFRVWDNQGQLSYLAAFLIRCMLVETHKYELDWSERADWERCLQNFEFRTHRQWLDAGSPPNPYYGGNNPLHLGLILSGLGEDALI